MTLTERAREIMLRRALKENPDMHPFEAAATMDGVTDDNRQPGGVIGLATYCDHLNPRAAIRPPKKLRLVDLRGEQKKLDIDDAETWLKRNDPEYNGDKRSWGNRN